MVSKLATFRTDSDIWDSFQDKAKSNGTNASALLQRFVRDYLDDKLDSRIDSPAASDVDIEAMVNHAVESRLDAVLEQVNQFRLDVNSLKTDDLLYQNLRTNLTVAQQQIEGLTTKLEALTSEATAPAKKPLIQIAREKVLAA
jgi:hypothetical protein